MDCKLVVSKLVRYLDEDLPPSIYRQITGHLDECYLCAEEYHELVRVTDVARHMLRCPVYRDGFERLRGQLRQPETSDILFYPRRLRRLKNAMTAAAVAAAVVLFGVTVGLPAVEAVQAFDAVMSAQFTGKAPVVEPADVRSHSLVAWSSQIRWAEKMAFDVKEAPQPPAEDQPAGQEPVTRAVPGTPPGPESPRYCKSPVIVLA